MRLRFSLGTVVLALLVAVPAWATGILMPKDEAIPPLAIKDQKITVTVTNNVARTTVEQIFLNSTNTPLEATYIFPIPAGASIDEFAMMMNGKRVKGEVLERNKARQVYSDIVRRMRDPGLIEHITDTLFQANIFPVPANGEQKIDISYSQVIKPDGAIAEYSYPLKTGNRASRILGNFSVLIQLDSKAAIKSIYSPSHKIDVARHGDHEAKISFEERGTVLDRDFQVFYTLSDKDFGLNLMAHRPKDKDGYFLMMIAPKAEVNEIQPKDVCFVLDTSGSMNGEKLTQARDALTYCVNALGEKDRFNIVRFSTEVDTFAKDLQPASKDQKTAAVEYIKKLEARGGTDLNGALETALKLKTADKRPFLVVFLTDGQPTIGVTEPNEILRNLGVLNKAETRVFVWGVGTDLNAMLLDQIADKTRATAQYVTPGENIEVKVSSFFDKVSSPVLSSLKLDLGKAEVFDVYPRELPDLFKGQQLTVFGRYKTPGHFAVKLMGTMNGKDQSFVFETAFLEAEDSNPFIATLWANRKVGYLLENIRQKGANKELEDEVIRLAREFGIVTPYTSYLVVEDERQLTMNPPPPTAAPGGPPVIIRRTATPMMDGADRRAEGLRARGLAKAGPAADTAAPAAGLYGGRDNNGRMVAEEDTAAAQDELAGWGGGMNAMEGGKAVTASKKLDDLKRADSFEAKPRSAAARRLAPVRIDARTFLYQEGVWTDQSWDPKKGDPVTIKYLSDAWFALAEQDADLKKAFALGEQVLVVLKNGKVIVVSTTDGKDKLTDAEVKDLLR